jgi:hypothetical protein
MTAEEVNSLLALAKANYGYAFKGMTRYERTLLVQSWTFALQDVPADVGMLAFMQLLSVSKWLPTIAEIRDQAGKLRREAEDMLDGINSDERMEKMLDADSEAPYATAEERSAKHRDRAIKRAIAGEVVRKTRDMARGDRGTDNGLSLAAMIESAKLRISPECGDPIRALAMPRGERYMIEAEAWEEQEGV